MDKAAQLRYDALRRWRTETARRRDVDADIILPNSILFTISLVNPATRDELATLSELSPWKLGAYSDQILQVLAQTALQPAS